MNEAHFIAEITSDAETETIRNVSKLYNIVIEYIDNNGQLIKDGLLYEQEKIMPKEISCQLHLVQ